MPIRTNRGRSAVYRRLWGWPLRSPRHLITFSIVLVALGIVVALLIPPGSPGASSQAGDTSTARSSNSPTADPSASTTPETRLTAPLSTATPAPPAPQALAVAVSFTRAWATHPAGISSQQWLAGLKAYTTDEYLPQLASVDPSNIPATKVTGAAVSVESTTASVVADVPTDGGTLKVTVIMTPHQGWRVSKYDKAS